jgi:gliding motility-associated-like protein
MFDGTEPDASDHIYTVTVNPEPPTVNLGRDTSLCSPERLLLDAGHNGFSYEWSTGSNDQTIWANEGDGLIWVKVFDEHHCSSVDSIAIQPCSAAKSLFVPNVFTPNGDGENDVWRIGGVQDFPSIIVTLFDRWGRLVFKSEPGYPKPWNGERNGKLLPMDAYFYVIDLKDGSEPLRGSVTLIP